MQYFRFAKSEIWSRERDKNQADAARSRFEFRNERDEREKAEKAERLAKAAAAKAATAATESKPDVLEAATATTSTPATDAEAAKKAAIAAAMERARQQREAVKPQNTDNLTVAQRKEIAEIDARRAPLQDDRAETTPASGAATPTPENTGETAVAAPLPPTTQR